MDHTIKSVKSIISIIKSALEDMIKQSSWMDDVTKDKAINKSKLIKPMVGFPDIVLDKVPNE